MDAWKTWQTKYGKLEKFFWHNRFIYYLDNQKISEERAMSILKAQPRTRSEL